MKVISLIIPCYNEEESFAPLYEKLCSVSQQMNEKYGIGFEFLMVNDGSRDQTLELIRNTAEADDRVKYISFSRNFGKEAAIYAGLQNCTGDYAVVIDADLQHPPDMLPVMYESIVNEGYDCATAYRESRVGEPKIRSFFARSFYKFINRIANVKMTDGATDYSMMTRQVVEAILTMPEYNRFYKGIHSWVGFETKWLPYQNIEREHGTTTWSFFGLFRYSMEGILSFSTAPLVLASLMGILLFLISLMMIGYVVIRTLLFGDPVAGFPTLISVILLIGGVQFFCLGIVGQYISKMYLEIKNRPVYLVKESKLGERRASNAIEPM
ncbi:MAG: glycosyltransferase family 2 protein [Turicibacter sp.]|nr:glycosyltransferase family 2 protein [Turicibacter sp.]